MFHSPAHHPSRGAPLRTSFSGSFMETKMFVSPEDIRSASSSQLRHVQELISTELLHRSQAKPYFIVEKSNDYLRVEEAHVIEDEDVPRYVRNHHGSVLSTFYITSGSIFHQTPEVGQVFEIYCHENKDIDVARRVATHG